MARLPRPKGACAALRLPTSSTYVRVENEDLAGNIARREAVTGPTLTAHYMVADPTPKRKRCRAGVGRDPMPDAARRWPPGLRRGSVVKASGAVPDARRRHPDLDTALAVFPLGPGGAPSTNTSSATWRLVNRLMRDSSTFENPEGTLSKMSSRSSRTGPRSRPGHELGAALKGVRGGGGLRWAAMRPYLDR